MFNIESRFASEKSTSPARKCSEPDPEKRAKILETFSYGEHSASVAEGQHDSRFFKDASPFSPARKSTFIN
jgi:hypothetical protein